MNPIKAARVFLARAATATDPETRSYYVARAANAVTAAEREAVELRASVDAVERELVRVARAAGGTT